MNMSTSSSVSAYTDEYFEGFLEICPNENPRKDFFNIEYFRRLKTCSLISLTILNIKFIPNIYRFVLVKEYKPFFIT